MFLKIAPADAHQRQTKRACAKEIVIMVGELVLSYVSNNSVPCLTLSLSL